MLFWHIFNNPFSEKPNVEEKNLFKIQELQNLNLYYNSSRSISNQLTWYVSKLQVVQVTILMMVLADSNCLLMFNLSSSTCRKYLKYQISHTQLWPQTWNLCLSIFDDYCIVTLHFFHGAIGKFPSRIFDCKSQGNVFPHSSKVPNLYQMLSLLFRL